MLSNILERLKTKLNDCPITLNENQIYLLSKIIKLYCNDILPIDVIKDNLKLSYDEVNEVLLYLSRKGFLKMNYKVWCENCNCNSEKQVFENFYDIPIEVCDRCDKRCRKIDNIIIVYRLINTDGK